MPGKLTRYRNNKQITKTVNRVLARKTETKHLTLVSGAFDYIGVSGAGTLIDLTSLIVQGTNDHQRIGNKITLTKLMLSKVMRVAQSTSARNCAVRLLVVQSRSGDLVVGDMPNYYSPCDLDKMFVMKDLFFGLSSSGSDYTTGNTGATSTRRVQLKFRRLPKPVVQYDGSTGNSINPVYVYIQAETGSIAEHAGFETIYYKDY